MTEKQYEDAMFALGCKDVTSKVQKKNGTTAFRMPDGKNMITEHKTGYIRRNYLNKNGSIYTCYQLNPQYKALHKVIASDGTLYEWEHNKRMLINNRAERLKRLVLYAIKDINQANG